MNPIKQRFLVASVRRRLSFNRRNVVGDDGITMIKGKKRSDDILATNGSRST
jgi:hypothetical protein